MYQAKVWSQIAFIYQTRGAGGRRRPGTTRSETASSWTRSAGRRLIVRTPNGGVEAIRAGIAQEDLAHDPRGVGGADRSESSRIGDGHPPLVKTHRGLTTGDWGAILLEAGALVFGAYHAHGMGDGFESSANRVVVNLHGTRKTISLVAIRQGARSGIGWPETGRDTADSFQSESRSSSRRLRSRSSRVSPQRVTGRARSVSKCRVNRLTFDFDSNLGDPSNW